MAKTTETSATPSPRKRANKHRVPDDETEIKHQLASIFRGLFHQSGMSQLRASEELGITQPNIWEVLHGRVRGYSVARLMRFIVALDHDVEIHVRSKPLSRPARITVHYQEIQESRPTPA